MDVTVVWDGTARTARSLDVISHPPEDIARYWQTLGMSTPEPKKAHSERLGSEPWTEAKRVRPVLAGPVKCHVCGVVITPGRARRGDRTCRPCALVRKAERLARQPISAPIQCRACERMIPAGKARMGYRRCRVCLGLAKPRPIRATEAVPCRLCDGMVSAKLAQAGRRICSRCAWRQRQSHITEPVPCDSCAEGRVPVSWARSGKKTCRRCLGFMPKPPRDLTPRPCRTCSGMLTETDVRLSRYTCRACLWKREKAKKAAKEATCEQT